MNLTLSYSDLTGEDLDTLIAVLQPGESENPGDPPALGADIRYTGVCNAIAQGLQDRRFEVVYDAIDTTDADLRELRRLCVGMRDLITTKKDGARRAQFWAELAAAVDEELVIRAQSCKELERIAEGITADPGDGAWTAAA